MRTFPIIAVALVTLGVGMAKAETQTAALSPSIADFAGNWHGIWNYSTSKIDVQIKGNTVVESDVPTVQKMGSMDNDALVIRGTYWDEKFVMTDRCTISFERTPKRAGSPASATLKKDGC